jgi:hypothetical protein
MKCSQLNVGYELVLSIAMAANSNITATYKFLLRKYSQHLFDLCTTYKKHKD